MGLMVIPIVTGTFGTVTKIFLSEQEDLVIRRLVEIIKTNSFIYIDKNSEKSSEELNRLDVSQTLAKKKIVKAGVKNS